MLHQSKPVALDVHSKQQNNMYKLAGGEARR